MTRRPRSARHAAGVGAPALAAALQAANDASSHAEVDRLADLLLAEAALQQRDDLAALAWARQSHSLYRRNRFEAAAQAADAALQAGRRCSDAQALAEGLVAWSRVQWAAGALDEALACLDEALPLAAAAADLRLLVHGHNLHGLVNADLGHHAVSLASHQAASDVADVSGVADLRLVARTNLGGRLLAVGQELAAQGDLSGARARWQQVGQQFQLCDAIARRHRLTLALPHLLVSQAGALLCQGDEAGAAAALARQRRLVARHGDRSSLPHAALVLARHHLARHDWTATLAAVQAGLTEAERLEARARQAELHLLACQAEEGRGDFRAALAHHRQFHALREQCAVEAAHRRSMALAVQLQTALARREAADARRQASVLASDRDALVLRAGALAREALQDPLTGLPNRRAFDQQWPAMHRHAHASGQPLALAVIDADHFKWVNDAHGHAVGDAVLRALGSLLRSHCRDDDLAARFGGEEFVLALHGASPEAAVQACERLRQAVAGYNWSAIRPGLSLTVSIGLTDAGALDDPAAAFEQADAAVYAAKRQGRDQVCRAAGPQPATRRTARGPARSTRGAGPGLTPS